MNNASQLRSPSAGEDCATAEYLREFQELISFSEENPTSFEEVKRRVDNFHDEFMFDILKDYQRQFAFVLTNLKVYSVFRAGASGDIPADQVPAQILAASQPFHSQRRER